MLINWHKNKSVDMPQILGQHYIQYLFFPAILIDPYIISF